MLLEFEGRANGTIRKCRFYAGFKAFFRILTFYFPILVGAFFAKNISKKVASVEDVIKEETTEIISEIQDDGELNVSDYDS